MCDYSMHSIKTRPAAVGDKLITNMARGFADVNDQDTAVCLLPGTEVAFDKAPVMSFGPALFSQVPADEEHPATAIFRKVDEDRLYTHHDALEWADGKITKLVQLKPDQTASVLQLPAKLPALDQLAEDSAQEILRWVQTSHGQAAQYLEKETKQLARLMRSD